MVIMQMLAKILLLSSPPFFSQLNLGSALPLPQGSRLMRFVSSAWIMNRLIICTLLHLSSWMSAGNRRTVFFSPPIGPWQKSRSITHPFWSLPNKGFSQEEKFLNNVSLKINSRLYYLTPRLCNSRKGSHEQSVCCKFVSSRTDWPTMWRGVPHSLAVSFLRLAHIYSLRE